MKFESVSIQMLWSSVHSLQSTSGNSSLQKLFIMDTCAFKDISVGIKPAWQPQSLGRWRNVQSEAKKLERATVQRSE